MTSPSPQEQRFVPLQKGQFWSGDLGLTLITISLLTLVFVITPLREAAIPGRFLVELAILVLMISGALTAEQTRIAKFPVIAFLLATALILCVGRLRPSPLTHQVGSVCSTITLLLYFRIVLLVMFRAGPVTWSRIQGGVCAYLLLGMAWASAFQVLEFRHPGSFRFVTAPQDLDQLISKLTYYSLTVLTSVGGDVAPVSPLARSLTAAEAVAGQLFPAILIGTLVAMAMHAQTNLNTKAN
jgi:hypothetical protein